VHLAGGTGLLGLAATVHEPQLLGGATLLGQGATRATRVAQPVDAAARVRQTDLLEQRRAHVTRITSQTTAGVRAQAPVQTTRATARAEASALDVRAEGTALAEPRAQTGLTVVEAAAETRGQDLLGLRAALGALLHNNHGRALLGGAGVLRLGITLGLLVHVGHGC